MRIFVAAVMLGASFNSSGVFFATLLLAWKFSEKIEERRK